MPIDPFREQVYTLTEAARRLPRLRRNRPVAPSTIWRWALVGLRGIRLETAMLGGVRVTSDDALRRFFAALSERGPPSQSPASVCSRRQETVERDLDRLGL